MRLIIFWMIPWFQTRIQNVHTNDRDQNQSSVLAKKLD